MNKIKTLFEEHIKSKPMLYIGLKFCIWFGLINFFASILLNEFPGILQNYLFLISEWSVLVLNNVFGLPYEMYELLSGIGIWSEGYLTVVINETCGGMPIYILFATLIMAFVSSWLKKLWAILLGLIILLLANNIRIIGIILVKKMMPNYFNFAHEILFVYFMYGLTLFLWYKFYKQKK